MNEMVMAAIVVFSAIALCRLYIALNRWLVKAVWWVLQVYVRKKCYFHFTDGRTNRRYVPGVKIQVTGHDLDHYGCTFDKSTFPMYQPVITEMPKSSQVGIRVPGHIWPSLTLAELELHYRVRVIRPSRYVNFYACIYDSIPHNSAKPQPKSEQ